MQMENGIMNSTNKANPPILLFGSIGQSFRDGAGSLNRSREVEAFFRTSGADTEH